MKHLKGKVAVITGAADGIGKGLAERAAAESMRLVLADIQAEKLEAVVADLKARGAEVLGMTVDVSQADQVDRLAKLAWQHFGHVHLLCNNAGVVSAKPAWETTARDWEWVVGINLFGITNGLRSFLPRMLAEGEEGHIVNTASMTGMASYPSVSGYNTTKFAVVGLTEGLHHDLRLRNARIGASVLLPHWVKTNLGSSANQSGAPTTSGPMDEVAISVAMAAVKAIDSGQPPAHVADVTFEAIQNERFYIFTHPDSLNSVRTRMEDILQDRAPTLQSL